MSITDNSSVMSNSFDQNYFSDLLLSDITNCPLLEDFSSTDMGHFSNILESGLTTPTELEFEFADSLLNNTFVSDNNTIETLLEAELDLHMDLSSNEDFSECGSLIPSPLTPPNEMELFLDYDITQLVNATSPPLIFRSRSSSVSTASSCDTPFDEDWATLLLNTLELDETMIGEQVEIVSPSQVSDQFKFIVYEPSSKGPKLTAASNLSQATKPCSPKVTEENAPCNNVCSKGSSKTHIFRCTFPDCEKTFSRQYNLTSHMRSHSDLRPYSCGFCPRSFARKHDLQRHTRLHTGSRPYECSSCLKGFPRSDALSRHYRVEEKCRMATQNFTS
ncbi:hypothetical protein K7432_004925 [Basidiobolus ranarum]|uniref:C2H2-type domain-containing protein n=1 Tax=Basidiobolus ranarum TaxID=34480 RepID=A0ABR2WXE2_9FUNG